MAIDTLPAFQTVPLANKGELLLTGCSLYFLRGGCGMSKPLEDRAGFEPAASRKCLRVCFLKAPSARIAATMGGDIPHQLGNCFF